MKQAKMEPIVENIDEGGSLYWLAPQTDRVLLYFHGTFGEASSLHGQIFLGGGFIFGGVPSAPAFWNFIQKNVKLRRDVVMLNYSGYWSCFSFLPMTRPRLQHSSRMACFLYT
jgi:hypothetical protein